MPEVPCPHPDCPYVTPDVGDAAIAALITGHTRTPTCSCGHAQHQARAREKTCSEGTAEEWEYILHRWEEYTMATNKTGCSNSSNAVTPQLRLGISRQAGTSMARYTEVEAMAAIKQLAVRAENIEVATNALLATGMSWYAHLRPG